MDHYTFNTSIVHVFSTFLYFDRYINEKEGEKEREEGRGRERKKERGRKREYAVLQSNQAFILDSNR